jgi:hypothetical protein
MPTLHAAPDSTGGLYNSAPPPRRYRLTFYNFTYKSCLLFEESELLPAPLLNLVARSSFPFIATKSLSKTT